MKNDSERALEALLSSGWLQAAYWSPEVDSTNSWARRDLNQVALPALFVADRQTAGRGRSQNQWWSPAGCLMLTLVVPASEAPLSPEQQPLLALQVGIAVAETVEHIVEPNLRGGLAHVQLKWPNDVYCAGKKLSGVLIETARKSSGDGAWLVGIGVNLNVDFALAPSDVRAKATSLLEQTGAEIDQPSALVELIENLQSQIESWRDDLPWLDRWSDRCMLAGKVVHLRTPSGEIVGRCEGVDSTGKLLVR
ncbi:MAG TPA: biotin--[acetyl-CoA-carboxylase] ligase, partial [Planctomycetaceae bacterium]|nr:biotin--[acetyl-CoA-carboxylase] ligase [Planctomycetaceae bacterium]